MPRPASNSGHVTTSGPAPASSAATSTKMPTKRDEKPNFTTRRGETSGKSFGTPTAARSSVFESGRIRTPVSTADSSWPLFD